MSNYPSAPPFGGPFAYVPQWPHASTPNSLPSLPPHTFPSNGDYTASISHSNANSFHQNSNIAGLGAFGATGTLPPPLPFMGLPPPPFPSFPLSSVTFPPVPLANGPQPDGRSVAAARTFANDGAVHTLDSQATTESSSRQDSDREEGEVSDMEGQIPSQAKEAGSERSITLNRHQDVSGGICDSALNSGFPRNRTQHLGIKDPGNFAAIPREVSGKTNQGTDEAPSELHPCSRDSESPYNPPISIAEVPHGSESEAPNSSAMRPKSPPMSIPKEAQFQLSTKSPSQLRIQAQGALLSLAPHNIRYSELVGEGINPMVLKQLYEEVGIKIATSQPGTSVPSVPVKLVASGHEANATADLPVVKRTAKELTDQEAPQQRKISEVEAANKALTPPVLSSTPQPDGGKPLERKEVIARMLAARAAKTSGTPQLSKPDAENESTVTTAPSVPATETLTLPSSEATESEKEIRVREKNKAQTELARQRIELLKKQGLTRTQSKPRAGSISQNTLQQNNDAVQVSTPPASSPAIRHPLPNRPPAPDPAPSARIPGLFMTEQSSHHEPNIKADGGAVTVSASQPRVTHRKRPRASDFNEPVVTSKSSFGHIQNGGAPDDRLIIDISDDEVFYGEADTDDMDIDSSADQILQDARSKALRGAKIPRLEGYPSSTGSVGQRNNGSFNTKISASSTPQSPFRNNDRQDLRQVDLEIQAMRRRIAEMEEKKKSKSASDLARPPGTLSPSRLSQAENAIPEVGLLQCPPAAAMPSIEKETAESTIISNGTHGTISKKPVSSESGELENLRFKLLRKKEIESGLPVLDAEILRSETRLAEVKEEMERLLAEIAKGKHGRQQLVEELQHLQSEANSHSLDEVETTQRLLENKEPPKNTEEATPMPNDTVDGDLAVPDALALQTGDSEGSRSASLSRDTGAATDLEPASASEPLDTAEHQTVFSAHVTDDLGEAPPAPSLSESGGSAMDESIDSALSEPVQEPALEQTAAASATPPDGSGTSESVDISETGSILMENSHDSLPERPRFTDAAAELPNAGDDDGQVDVRNSRESSAESEASEAYEPPEPDTSADSADELYTPSFSPSSGRGELPDVSAHTVGQPQADKPLTGTVLVSDVSQTPEVGNLDHAQKEMPGFGFSPYHSPLRFFRAYRYHPNFVDNVSGGYRSLTYSHDIDPMVYVCPFEVAGGVCNDRSCEFQHFRDMTLSDDKILVQMGSLREGKTQEEKDNYLAGLKQIINDMRRDQVKDFSTVAAEIAAYRRRFLQDPSRILPL
ncbi:hypothetical protein MAP00_004768 [Monascus purpureus]|nr:hypothetical protein MAP00_004768 [Monascus purpureus]